MGEVKHGLMKMGPTRLCLWPPTPYAARCVRDISSTLNRKGNVSPFVRPLQANNKKHAVYVYNQKYKRIVDEDWWQIVKNPGTKCRTNALQRIISASARKVWKYCRLSVSGRTETHLMMEQTPSKFRNLHIEIFLFLIICVLVCQ